MLRKMFLVLLASAVVLPVQARAGIFGMSKKDVDAEIKEYLMKNPEVVKEALDKYFEKEDEKQKQATVSKLGMHRFALERNPVTPVIGNPDGDVTIVEFFDYNCGYCKMMFPKVWEFVKNDGNIRWVMKDLPSLGPTSETAARAGLAAAKQGKYFEMHQAMITHKGALSEKDIVAYAKKVGLNMKDFERDRKDPALDKILEANRKLATALEFNGIPDFIIGDFVNPGAMMGDELDTAVAAARKKTEK